MEGVYYHMLDQAKGLKVRDWVIGVEAKSFLKELLNGKKSQKKYKLV